MIRLDFVFLAMKFPYRFEILATSIILSVHKQKHYTIFERLSHCENFEVPEALNVEEEVSRKIIMNQSNNQELFNFVSYPDKVQRFLNHFCCLDQCIMHAEFGMLPKKIYH